jgi:tripartite-type tricarboxylate transporter receptor subunit TctC
MNRIVRCLLACAATCLADAGFAQPAAWPAKPLHFVVPFAPGGPPDVIARLIGPKLSEILGQPAIVDNRAGAGGNIGTAAVAKAAPDGYTVLMTSSAFAVNVSFLDAGYSVERDFVAVTVIAAQPNVIFVHPGVPARTLAEFFAYAKERKLAFASPGSGTTPHLTGENLFNIVGKLGLPAVHFRGAGPAAAAVVAGEPPVGSMAVTAPLPFIKAGRLRALAVSSAKRIAALPEVPTLVESGYPAMLDYTWVGLFLPSGTPAAVVQKLYDAVRLALQSPEVKERMEGLAFDAIAEPPARTAEYVKAEIAKWGQVVRATGAKPD